MTTPEEIWRSKSDEQVATAIAQLGEYTELGRQVILAEASRRGLPIEQARRDFELAASTQARTGASIELVGDAALKTGDARERPNGPPDASAGGTIGKPQPRQRILLLWDSPPIRKLATDTWAYEAPQVCVGCGSASALTVRRLATPGAWAVVSTVATVAVAVSLALYLRLGPIGQGILIIVLLLLRFLLFRPRPIAMSYSECAPCLTAEKREREQATLRFFVLCIASGAAGAIGGVLADGSKGSPVLVAVFGIGGVALMVVLFAWALWSLAGMWRSRRLVARRTRGGLVLASRSAAWVERVREGTSGASPVEI